MTLEQFAANTPSIVNEWARNQEAGMQQYGSYQNFLQQIAQRQGVNIEGVGNVTEPDPIAAPPPVSPPPVTAPPPSAPTNPGTGFSTLTNPPSTSAAAPPYSFGSGTGGPPQTNPNPTTGPSTPTRPVITEEPNTPASGTTPEQVGAISVTNPGIAGTAAGSGFGTLTSPTATSGTAGAPPVNTTTAATAGNAAGDQLMSMWKASGGDPTDSQGFNNYVGKVEDQFGIAHGNMGADLPADFSTRYNPNGTKPLPATVVIPGTSVTGGNIPGYTPVQPSTNEGNYNQAQNAAQGGIYATQGTTGTQQAQTTGGTSLQKQVGTVQNDSTNTATTDAETKQKGGNTQDTSSSGTNTAIGNTYNTGTSGLQTSGTNTGLTTQQNTASQTGKTSNLNQTSNTGTTNNVEQTSNTGTTSNTGQTAENTQTAQQGATTQNQQTTNDTLAMQNQKSSSGTTTAPTDVMGFGSLLRAQAPTVAGTDTTRQGFLSDVVNTGGSQFNSQVDQAVRNALSGTAVTGAGDSARARAAGYAAAQIGRNNLDERLGASQQLAGPTGLSTLVTAGAPYGIGSQTSNTGTVQNVGTTSNIGTLAGTGTSDLTGQSQNLGTTQNKGTTANTGLNLSSGVTSNAGTSQDTGTTTQQNQELNLGSTYGSQAGTQTGQTSNMGGSSTYGSNANTSNTTGTNFSDVLNNSTVQNILSSLQKSNQSTAGGTTGFSNLVGATQEGQAGTALGQSSQAAAGQIPSAQTVNTGGGGCVLCTVAVELGVWKNLRVLRHVISYKLRNRRFTSAARGYFYLCTPIARWGLRHPRVSRILSPLARMVVYEELRVAGRRLPLRLGAACIHWTLHAICHVIGKFPVSGCVRDPVIESIARRNNIWFNLT